jgi:hypothetical protein
MLQWRGHGVIGTTLRRWSTRIVCSCAKRRRLGSASALTLTDCSFAVLTTADYEVGLPYGLCLMGPRSLA